MNTEDSLRRRIDTRSLYFTFARSSGPGGQNVNKVNTRATLWFDLTAETRLTEQEKARIRSRLASRVSQEGLLHVVSSRHRTQSANREAALDRFFELLANALHMGRPRRPTKAPKSAKIRRLREKQSTSERKQSRSRHLFDE